MVECRCLKTEQARMMGSGPVHKSTVAEWALGAEPIIAPATYNGNDRSPLRQALDTAIAEADGSKLSLKDLTVLAPQNDPFRLDTPANHRDSKWLADTLAALAITGRFHLRGLHYAISMAPTPFTKPDGSRYVNDDRNWDWISAVAMKAARWLGYIPWDTLRQAQR